MSCSSSNCCCALEELLVNLMQKPRGCTFLEPTLRNWSVTILERNHKSRILGDRGVELGFHICHLFLKVSETLKRENKTIQGALVLSNKLTRDFSRDRKKTERQTHLSWPWGAVSCGRTGYIHSCPILSPTPMCFWIPFRNG